jgi:hypothetical protein
MKHIGMAHTPLFRQTYTAFLEHSPKNCNQFHQGLEMRIFWIPMTGNIRDDDDTSPKLPKCKVTLYGGDSCDELCYCTALAQSFAYGFHVHTQVIVDTGLLCLDVEL